MSRECGGCGEEIKEGEFFLEVNIPLENKKGQLEPKAHNLWVHTYCLDLLDEEVDIK